MCLRVGLQDWCEGTVLSIEGKNRLGPSQGVLVRYASKLALYSVNRGKFQTQEFCILGRC